MRLNYLIIFLIFFIGKAKSAENSKFKLCEQSGFCRRLRNARPGISQFQLEPTTFNSFLGQIQADILNRDNNKLLKFQLFALKDNTFQVLINEKTPLKSRYRTEYVILNENIKEINFEIVSRSNSEIIVKTLENNNKIIIQVNPFKIDFYQNDILTVSANGRGLMKFEHYQRRRPLNPRPRVSARVQMRPDPNFIPEIEDESLWVEQFQTFTDNKINGPEAIGLDFSFPEADVLFGIPQHADSFILKSTNGTDPYRLYNLDVAHYDLDSKMALYGSVPVIYGHGQQKTSGIFWLNPSETWVDTTTNEIDGQTTSANFFSESGVMEFFVFLGPTPLQSFKQYTDLTGVTSLPQLYTLGYHQSRWNYINEQDIENVHNKFNEFDIPLDTLWLDIEYTDKKKYFTWDSENFPNPLEMIYNLTEAGRHLIIIIDPHIKRDDNYFVNRESKLKGYYVKTKSRRDYEGQCWPGLSSYIDFFNPEARKYYADQYLLENFNTTTKDVMIWNDMNEPTVFDGPEKTMPKENIHYGGWEHRNVHNLYGHMQVLSTHDGLMRRSGNTRRPFILTRSHFAGSQRYAAIWTGDNTADWNNLQASIKMCLTSAIAGFSFCGADIGGFFGNPEPELFERWYQAAAFQPFMRSHADRSTNRREPYLFPDSLKVIRDAIRKRYSYLPFWYTKFYEHEKFGYPIMRPLLTQYPRDKITYKIDNEYLLWNEILVRPVLEKNVTSVDVYFPKINDDIWYDIDTFEKIDKSGCKSISVTKYKIPVFQRGGTIIPKKEKVRRSTTQMKTDPYTLIVCLDQNNEANGTLFIDDEESFEYRNGKYFYLSFEYKNGILKNKQIDGSGFDMNIQLSRVVLVGYKENPNLVTLTTKTQESVQLEIYQNENSIDILCLGVNIGDEWLIKIEN